MKTAEDNRREVIPTPVGYHAKLAEHHWLEKVDWDGRDCGLIVLQWCPVAQQWAQSGNVGTGAYIDARGWRYISVCPLPSLDEV